MKSKFINVLMFTVGAAIGSAVTWKIVKTKYDRIVQEEIESIREAFDNNRSDDQEKEEDCEDEEVDTWEDENVKQIRWEDLEDLDEENDEDESDYAAQYSALTSNYTNEKGGADIVDAEPYVIDPIDFGDVDGYNTVELTYYSDGTLEDEDYNVITNVDELIGPKALTTFGEYEDDSVYVRNERLSTDFQILKDYRTYEQARSNGPKWVADE